MTYRFALLLPALLFACDSAEWRPVAVPDEALAIPPTPGAEDDVLSDDLGPEEIDPKELGMKIAQFSPARISADLSKLSKNDKAALDKLIQASKLLDPVFDRQAYAKNPELEAELAKDKTAEGKKKLEYFRIMRGPWDRQDHHRPFATNDNRPPGAGFYPEDLSAEQLDAYVKKHPAEEKKLLDLFTVVRREGGKLVAVPYSKAYAQWLEPSAKLLEEAANLTENASLKKFLKSRAQAFRSDDYYQSDKDWMDLDSAVEVTIGPYEVYEDELKGAKASFESFVTVTDPEASKKLAKYKGMLVDMEKNLPVPENVKTTRGRESPIRVVDLVFTAGDARKSVQTIAFNLPNDERVRKEKGAKKVLLRNVIQKKFDVILKPIGQKIIDPSQSHNLSADAFFNQVLFHELSHSLGPSHTKKDGKKVEVRQALEQTYSAIEECKADVMGAYNLLYMIQRGEFDKNFREPMLTSYFAGLFRSVRFGVAEAHGKGAAIQINRFLEAGAATFDKGRFKIDYAKLEKAVSDLVRDLVMVQHNGDKGSAQSLLDKYGMMSAAMKEALASVKDVPVDLRPIYPAAGEN